MKGRPSLFPEMAFLGFLKPSGSWGQDVLLTGGCRGYGMGEETLMKWVLMMIQGPPVFFPVARGRCTSSVILPLMGLGTAVLMPQEPQSCHLRVGAAYLGHQIKCFLKSLCCEILGDCRELQVLYWGINEVAYSDLTPHAPSQLDSF